MSARVRCGASSWADRSLVREGDFYPRPSMRAADRLAYYAGRLPLAEITASHWFPPTPEQTALWAARTPPNFRFDVQAWSLFTAAGTIPSSLWPDLQDEVKPEARDRPRLYHEHLSGAAVEESWARFRHALVPMAAAGRLGAVVFRLPAWVRPGRTSTAMLAGFRSHLPDWPVAVEPTNHRWLEGDACEETLALFEDLDLALVCVDRARPPGGPPAPPVAATANLALVRFAGRRPGRWPWPYRYTDEELAGWEPVVRQLGAGGDEVHLLFSNTFSDDAVDNAVTMAALVDGGPQGQPTLF